MAKHLPDPRGRILDAALVLFARFGVEGTTLSDLAQRARLAKTTLYHHFPDGKGMIFKVAVEGMLSTHWGAFESTVREQPDPVSQLACYARLRLHTFDREMARWGLTQETWESMKPAVNVAMQPYYARELALLTDVVSAGIADGQLRAGHPATIAGILQAAFRGLTLDGRLDTTAREREAELTELAEFVAGGLLAPSARTRWRKAMGAPGS
ncbi:MAG: TetR/AcrR family transcriptional regulator [Polyangiales bacterium]|nr:TetR/AcrR family transcriptional regulator [Myxococcales bacterium]MCB9656827.1 TetR/AcrR family transcriptional regulator [Sandaracinaceae bacterium]